LKKEGWLSSSINYLASIYSLLCMQLFFSFSQLPTLGSGASQTFLELFEIYVLTLTFKVSEGFISTFSA